MYRPFFIVRRSSPSVLGEEVETTKLVAWMPIGEAATRPPPSLKRKPLRGLRRCRISWGSIPILGADSLDFNRTLLAVRESAR